MGERYAVGDVGAGGDESSVDSRSRLPLEVEALPGNESHGVYGAEGLWKLLDHRLPRAGQPWCIRGDISYGNETLIAGCIERHRDCWFKLRESTGIKALIAAFDDGVHPWVDAGQGWQGREVTAQRVGWSSTRRRVILRRSTAASKPTTAVTQPSLFVAEVCPEDGHEYAVLVTSLCDPLITARAGPLAVVAT